MCYTELLSETRVEVVCLKLALRTTKRPVPFFFFFIRPPHVAFSTFIPNILVPQDTTKNSPFNNQIQSRTLSEVSVGLP